MNTVDDIRDFMQRCVGLDNQDSWMSLEPADPLNYKGFIYVIHSLITDQFYIGCKLYQFKVGKKFIASDWKDYWGSSKYLSADIEEHGIENFERYIISQWKTKRSVANAESNLLHKLDVLTAQKDDETYWFYNRAIGKAFRNVGHTQEAREKMSQSRLGEKNHRFGTTPSQETREKMSKAQQGKVLSKETRAKISKANSGENHHLFGKTLPQETREKMSKAHRGKIFSKEHRENISKAKRGEKHYMWGKTHSQETREKLSGKNSVHARLANVYCHETDKIIAEEVVIGDWCKESEYDFSHLAKTARADRSLPSTKSNRHQHKGIYARYLDNDE